MSNRKSISKELRFKVYNKYKGHCAYCGCELRLEEMQIDHLKDFYNNGENLNFDNLMPSCRQCNFYKSTHTLEVFRSELGKLRERLNKEFIYRLSKKYDLITENDKEIKFYFEVLYDE